MITATLFVVFVVASAIIGLAFGIFMSSLGKGKERTITTVKYVNKYIHVPTSESLYLNLKVRLSKLQEGYGLKIHDSVGTKFLLMSAGLGGVKVEGPYVSKTYTWEEFADVFPDFNCFSPLYKIELPKEDNFVRVDPEEYEKMKIGYEEYMKASKELDELREHTVSV